MTRPRQSAAARSGVSVPEVLVALLLGLLVVQLGLRSLSRMEATRASLVSRTDALVALRVGRHVLRRELRHGRPLIDWSVGGDSLWLRAFRGAAVVCASDSVDASVVVSYSGDRAPDPTKDSIVLFDAMGASEVRALMATSTASSHCWGPGGSARWVLDRGVSPGVVVAKLFEHGSYHLAGGALRYRRGGAGRQPLTPDVWAPATGWAATTERLGLHIVPAATAAGTAWSGFLARVSAP